MPGRRPAMSMRFAAESRRSLLGARTCAVVASGVMCWGDARFGQSGREVGERVLRPGLVPGTDGAVEVAAGVRHSCARLATGRVLCWGELIDAAGHAHARADPVA